MEFLFRFTAIDCCMNRVFHKDRWYQAFICDGKYQMPSSNSGTWEAVEPVDDSDSDEKLDESVAVKSRPNLTGYIEPKEEYSIEKKVMSEAKVTLD